MAPRKQVDAAGIAGKALTLFVLARIVELTAGRSQRADVALLVNNARVAACIARQNPARTGRVGAPASRACTATVVNDRLHKDLP